MFLEIDKLNVCVLKKMCKKVCIKKYSTMKKDQLLNEYNRYLACKIIQRCYRNYFYKNAVDHISLENISYPCFVYQAKPGTCYFYTHESIIKYIMKTGDTRDPMTRNPYTDQELKRLDLEAKHYFPGIKYRSTLKIKKNLSYARRIRNIENEILSFEMRLDELKENILHIIGAEMNTWIYLENFIVDNVQYQSIQSYINTILHEFKITLLNLKQYNVHLATSFKQDILEKIDSNDEIYKFI